MKELYQLVGVSKQGFFQHQADVVHHDQMEERIIAMVVKLRKDHPAMGARKMYHMLSPLPIGRDAFEQLVLAKGFRVRVVKNFTKTTHRSKRYLCYPNLCAGLSIQGINRVWSSDITYYRLEDGFRYLVFEIDLYSRRILGFAVSESLEPEANLKALKAAFATRGIVTYQFKLIHHSDPGTQYLCNAMLKLSRKHKYRISIGTSVWENPHIERVNGIIKNEYLRFMDTRTTQDLVRATSRAVELYNTKRPHWSLGLMTPVEFEQYIASIPMHQRPVLRPWTEPDGED